MRTARKPDTPLGRFVRAYFSSRIATVAAALLFVLVLLALCAPMIAPQDPYDLMKLDRFTLVPVKSENKSETARRWVFAGGRGEIGIIAPVSEPFCGHCNRLRLTADGKIRTCLFSVVEHDLRSRLRGGANDAEIADWLQSVVWQKEDRHHIGEPEFVQPERTMSCIGG